MKRFLFRATLIAAFLVPLVSFGAIKWQVNDGNLITAGTLYGCRLQAGEVSNCEVGVSGSTLTISGDNGVALSATNKCQVGIQSNTAGRATCATFTANVTATFGAASDTDGNLFGITDANWSNTLPMFLGVVTDGTTPYWIISRLPYRVTGAAAMALCQKGDTDCDAQSDMMILTTGLTLANWVNLNVTQVGWFNATYATVGGAWTFAVSAPNGFNFEYEKVKFTFPTLQNGANLGYLINNGGTPPTNTTNSFFYWVYRNGEYRAEVFINGDAGADGSGAVGAQMASPFFHGTSNDSLCGIAELVFVSNITTAYVSCLSAAQYSFTKNIGTTASNSSNLLWSDFANGNRRIAFTLTGRAL